MCLYAVDHCSDRSCEVKVVGHESDTIKHYLKNHHLYIQDNNDSYVDRKFKVVREEIINDKSSIGKLLNETFVDTFNERMKEKYADENEKLIIVKNEQLNETVNSWKRKHVAFFSFDCFEYNDRTVARDYYIKRISKRSNGKGKDMNLSNSNNFN